MSSVVKLEREELKKKKGGVTEKSRRRYCFVGSTLISAQSLSTILYHTPDIYRTRSLPLYPFASCFSGKLSRKQKRPWTSTYCFPIINLRPLLRWCHPWRGLQRPSSTHYVKYLAPPLEMTAFPWQRPFPNLSVAPTKATTKTAATAAVFCRRATTA